MLLQHRLSDCCPVELPNLLKGFNIHHSPPCPVVHELTLPGLGLFLFTVDVYDCKELSQGGRHLFSRGWLHSFIRVSHLGRILSASMIPVIFIIMVPFYKVSHWLDVVTLFSIPLTVVAVVTSFLRFFLFVRILNLARDSMISIILW
jgi:hypothetical protein